MRYDFDALARLSDADVTAWAARSLAPQNATLVVVGALDVGEAERLVRERFHDWPARASDASLYGLPSIPPPPPRDIVIFDRPAFSQTSVHLLCPLGPVTATDLAAQYVTRRYVQNLWRSLRYGSGATDSLDVHSYAYRGGAAFLALESPVQNDQAVVAVRTTLIGIGLAAQARAPLSALQLAKWDVARATRIDNLELDDMVATLAQLERLGLPPLATLRALPAKISAVSAADVAGILGPCAGHEVLGLVGPAAVLAPALAAEGLAATLLAGELLHDRESSGLAP